MSDQSRFVNQQTAGLKPYPMEALTRIRNGLNERGVKVFDFGTGDPKIPYWSKISDVLKENVTSISQYPTARGSKDLCAAQVDYMKNRFAINLDPSKYSWMTTRGSKEAIFHIPLSLVGRSGGKRTIIYPDPGYPVYYSSTVFAGGIPYPVQLQVEHRFLMQPWDLPEAVQKDAAAMWINYPHNPTGAIADRAYWERIINWAHDRDCVVLSDDCYVDIYDSEIDKKNEVKQRPVCPLEISQELVLCFFSLSKRSGMTGFRSGFMVGDARVLGPHLEARANMGVGMPQFIEAASATAWRDEAHVAERRKIFTERIRRSAPVLQKLGLLDDIPQATFYLWCRIPEKFGTDDVRFCMELAEKGVITSPSQWLSHGICGYFRIALVPDAEDTAEAMDILKEFCK